MGTPHTAYGELVNKEFAKNTAIEIVKKARLSEDNIEFITQILVARHNRGMKEFYSASKEDVISTFKSFNLERPAPNAAYRIVLLKVINKSEAEWFRQHDHYVEQLNVEHPHESAPKVRLDLPKVQTSKTENIFDKVDSFAKFLKEDTDALNYWSTRYEPFLPR